MANLHGKDKAKHVVRLFRRIANSYDLLNTLMSGGRHRDWRKQAIQMFNLSKNGIAIDVATGTGLHFEAHVQRDGKCYHVRADRDGGVLFKPCGRKISSGDGIFLKKGQNIYNGEGLLLGPNSPYISNTILGWLL